MLLFFSCKKEFLNKKPLDQVSSVNFWKSEADVQMALAGVYDRLRGGGGASWGASSLTVINTCQSHLYISFTFPKVYTRNLI